MEASQAQDRLRQQVSDKERALQENRLRGFQEIEAMKRNQEFYAHEFYRKNTKSKNINNLTNRVRELHCEINRMHDSQDFKDAASMHSGQPSRVPSESAPFLLHDDRGGLLGHATLMPPYFGDTRFTTGDVFSRPHVYPSSSYSMIPTPWNNPDTGRVPGRTCTGGPAPENGDGGTSAIPNSRFLRSASTRNSPDYGG